MLGTEGMRGGGVLLAVHNYVTSRRRFDLEENCELVIVELCPSKGSK